MEPRPIRRGNAANGISAGQLSTWLQWSHVQSDVETRAFWIILTILLFCFNGATSNQTWKRGSYEVNGEVFHVASMEPRPIRRGNAAQLGSLQQAVQKLQWSHVQSDVETTTRIL